MTFPNSQIYKKKLIVSLVITGNTNAENECQSKFQLKALSAGYQAVKSCLQFHTLKMASLQKLCYLVLMAPRLSIEVGPLRSQNQFSNLGLFG